MLKILQLQDSVYKITLQSRTSEGEVPLLVWQDFVQGLGSLLIGMIGDSHHLMELM